MVDVSFPGLGEPGSTQCLSAGELRENVEHFTIGGGVLGVNLHPSKDVLVAVAGEYWQVHAVTVAAVNGRIALVLHAQVHDEALFPEVHGAVGRALGLHVPETAGQRARCAHCSALKGGGVAWPCPTVEALGMTLADPEVPGAAGAGIEPLRADYGDAAAVAIFPYASGIELTAANPEPPHGVVVRICDGSYWHRTDDHARPGGANWEQVESEEFDPESWMKLAGSYGPVTVVNPDQAGPTGAPDRQTRRGEQMTDVLEAERRQVNTPWGIGFKGLVAGMFDDGAPLFFTRHAREGEAVFDVHAYDDMVGTAIVALALPDGSACTLLLENAEVSEDGRSVTVTLRPQRIDPATPATPETGRSVDPDPVLAERICAGLNEAEDAHTAYRDSLAADARDDR